MYETHMPLQLSNICLLYLQQLKQQVIPSALKIDVPESVDSEYSHPH